MIKYNTRKRATYKINTRKMAHMKDEICDARNNIQRIHINVHYDTYNHTEYVPIIYRKTRNNKAQRYVNITNAINDIFPDINTPHTAHTYRATAPYKAFIPTTNTYLPPLSLLYKEETHTIYKRDRVKCIIYNDAQEIIHYGIFIRTIDINGKDIIYKLHRSNRCIEVKPFIPFTQTINGVDIHEIWRHNVEIYRI